MRALSSQLTLGFCLQDEATFANFHIGNNIEVVAQLQKTVQGSGERLVYLYGTRGQGCSHLLQACCHYAQQQQVTSVYLPFANLITMSPEVLMGLETLSVLCLDDVHLIAGLKDWEEAVFHLYNRVYDQGGRMIIAAHDVPQAIQLHLPDLVSRLSWGGIYQIQSLADQDKLAVLISRASHRGITLSEEVAKYILTHCPRHMATLFAALDALDKASLAAQRRLTIPFVKEVLQI